MRAERILNCRKVYSYSFVRDASDVSGCNLLHLAIFLQACKHFSLWYVVAESPHQARIRRDSASSAGSNPIPSRGYGYRQYAR